MDILLNKIKVGEIDFIENSQKDSAAFENYFVNQIGLKEEDFLMILKKIPTTASIIKFITIHEDFQKKGIATKEIKNLINRAKDSVILVCEMDKPWLIDWYRRLGFETIGHYRWLPIMILLK